MKLTPKRKTEFRVARLAELGHVCELCGTAILEGQAVLDHCHKLGHIRGVIHRGCNSALGKVENAAVRYKVPLKEFAAGLEAYLNKYSTNVHDLVHDSFYTPAERKERAKARARRRNAKRNIGVTGTKGPNRRSTTRKMGSTEG